MQSRLAGLSGAAAGQTGHPAYFNAGNMQMVHDALVALRILAEGDFAPIADVDAALTGFAPDADAVLGMGISMGSAILQHAMIADDTVRAAVLDVAYSGLEFLCDAPFAAGLRDVAYSPLLGLRGSFDDARRYCMQPAFDHYRWAIELTDPATLAPAMYTRPITSGARPDLLYQHGDRDTVVGILGPDALVAATGIPGLGYPYADVAPLTAPVSANLMSGGAMVTAGAWRFSDANHDMQFRGDFTTSWSLPLVPPFERLDEPTAHTNPRDAVNRQLTEFFRTHLETGRAAIVDPATL